MKQEAKTCANCTIKVNCDMNLQPEVFHGDDVPPWAIEDQRQLPQHYCRHYTCGIGSMFASQALTSRTTREYTIHIANSTQNVKAVAFGSTDKPTEIDALRIVSSTTGEIYSKQGEHYYRTGQKVKL